LSEDRLLKEELRRKYIKMRRAIPPELKARLDLRVYDNFTRLEEYVGCETLLIYVSGPAEVDTRRIIAAAIDDGKRVAVPKCLDMNGDMDFFLIDGEGCLEKGAFGIAEPKRDCKRLTDFSDALCAVPGLGFDREGFRLGFGKGYYDRFLARFKGLSAGLCYSEYVSEVLPRNAYDRSVDILATESAVYRI